MPSSDRKVRDGRIYVCRTVKKPCLILRVQDFENEAQVAITVEEAETLIEDLKRMLEKIKQYPNGLRDNPNIEEIY